MAALFFGVVFSACAFAEITCLTPQITHVDDPTLDTDCNSTPSKLKKYLLDSGYNETSTAGIMGNIRGESRYRTKLIEGGAVVDDDFRAFTNGNRNRQLYRIKEDGTRKNKGFGLAQWTTDGRLKNLQNYADSISQPITTVETQAAFLVKELNEKFNMSPDVLNAMTIEEVTWIILRDFETPMSVACTHKGNEDCTNNKYPRHKSLTEVLADPNNYKMAIKSYSARLEYARAAYVFAITDCGTGETPSDPGTPTTPSDPSEPYDPTPETPGTGEDTDPGTPTATTGALGKQSSSGFYAQGNFRGVVWRKNGADISSSGCSLIAVANSAKYRGVTPNDPKQLASWSKGVISGESDTGWNGSVSKTISHLGMRWGGGSYLWSDYRTSTSTKIAKIRQTLAAGGVIIAGGDRNKSSNPNRQSIDCTSSSNKNAGLCVFSNNGHFIAIIGITADDKLIVANAANGRNGTSTNDKLNADNVLKFSNKAIAVYK